MNTGQENHNVVISGKTHPQLYRKAVFGGGWIFALRGVTQILSFARFIILANMLGKENMGLIGIALLMMQILSVFSNTGFRSALIQKKDDIEGYLDSAWTLGIIRGFVLLLILYFGAPLFAGIKVPPEKVALTVNIIRVIGISFVLQSFANIGTIYFHKELQFDKHFIFQVVATLLDVITTISIVLIYKSVWALVIGKLAGDAMRCVLSYAVHDYRPHISFNLARARELWKFGKWVTGGMILGFLLNQGDDLFVWSYLGVSALGLYTMAYKITNIPATEIADVISQVTFPAYSKLQDDIPRLKDAYLKVLELASFLSIPIAALICYFSEDFVRLFMEPEWMPMVPAMQILAIFGVVRTIGVTAGPILFATKRPHINAFLQLIKLVMIIVMIYPLTRRYGITGTAIAVVAAGVLVQPFVIYVLVKALQLRYLEMLKILLLPAVAMGIALAVTQLFVTYVSGELTIVWFFAAAVLAGLVYIGLIVGFGGVFGFRIKENISEQLSILVK
jgi:O-antigen/teichoic acid export membrane protein